MFSFIAEMGLTQRSVCNHTLIQPCSFKFTLLRQIVQETNAHFCEQTHSVTHLVELARKLACKTVQQHMFKQHKQYLPLNNQTAFRFLNPTFDHINYN